MSIPQPTWIFAPGPTGILDPRMTVTRSQIGYRRNRFGLLVPTPINTARITHDPSDMRRLGYYNDGPFTAASQKITNPEDMNNASWTKTNLGTITSDAGTGPDGAASIDQIPESAATGQHSEAQNITITAGNIVMVTGHARPNTRSQFAVEVLAGAQGGRLHFDMTDGSAVTENVAPGTANAGAIYSLLGGLWQWWASITPGAAGGTTAAIKLLLKNGSGLSAISYAGDGASNLQWGWINAYDGSSSLGEAGDDVYEYQPAGGQFVVETCTGPTSPWLNSTEGTFVVHCRSPKRLGANANFCPFCIDDGGTNQRIFVAFSVSSNISFNVYNAGVNQASIGPSGILPNTDYRIACAYKANDFACCVNGGAVSTDTSGTVPTGLTTVRVGNDVQQSRPLNAPIYRIAYYPRRLANADMQTATA